MVGKRHRIDYTKDERQLVVDKAIEAIKSGRTRFPLTAFHIAQEFLPANRRRKITSLSVALWYKRAIEAEFTLKKSASGGPQAAQLPPTERHPPAPVKEQEAQHPAKDIAAAVAPLAPQERAVDLLAKAFVAMFTEVLQHPDMVGAIRKALGGVQAAPPSPQERAPAHEQTTPAPTPAPAPPAPPAPELQALKDFVDDEPPAVAAATPILPFVKHNPLPTQTVTLHKPKKVLIAGMLPVQAETIKNEFGRLFELRFMASDCNHGQAKELSGNSDHTLAMIDFINHSLEGALRRTANDFRRVNGGVTGMRLMLQQLLPKTA